MSWVLWLPQKCEKKTAFEDFLLDFKASNPDLPESMFTMDEYNADIDRNTNGFEDQIMQYTHKGGSKC